jgi:hypothetical protein
MLRVTRDLILPTAITGSYPRPLWYDASLSGRSFKSALGDSLFREQYLSSASTPTSSPSSAPAAAAGTSRFSPATRRTRRSASA